ncbi:MAG: paraquat-inducible protein A [Lysobacterales bacterium]
MTTTALQKGWAVCRVCREITDEPNSKCATCGTPVHSRLPNSVQRVWALWLAGVIAYIPGNLLPIMRTETLGSGADSTIVGGVVALIHHGSYVVAFVVFAASILVPVSKFAIIAWLAMSVQRGAIGDDHRRHRAHQAIELIGRWSMIDVFVVAALAALIQLGAVMTIKPGPGVVAFAVSVALTMLSAMALDPRLIWDPSLRSKENGGRFGRND